MAAGIFYRHPPFWTAFWGRNFRISLWNQILKNASLLFRKTQKRDWFQTKSGAKRSDFSISRVFLTHWQKYCKTLWTKEFYKIISRMVFSGRLKGGQKKWRLVFLTPPSILNCFLRRKTQNFAVKSNSENRFTYSQKNSE